MFSFCREYARCRDVRMVIAWAKSSPAVQELRRILGLFGGGRSSMPRRSLFAVLVILAAYNNLAAQVSVNDVHILPRSVPTSPARTEQTIRANVDLVLVSVTVLDDADRAVAGLGPTNFAVFDDKDPQVVRYLSNVDEPISLIVILDASASMAAENPRPTEGVH